MSAHQYRSGHNVLVDVNVYMSTDPELASPVPLGCSCLRSNLCTAQLFQLEHWAQECTLGALHGQAARWQAGEMVTFEGAAEPAGCDGIGAVTAFSSEHKLGGLQ
jgi:hypothetical protein